MTYFRRPSRSTLLTIIALLALPLLLFWDVTLGGKTMLPVDNLFQWQPWAVYAEQFGATQPQNSLLSDLMIQNFSWKQFAVDSLKRGEIPLWNPNIFAGQPFLANGQHSMYYPFSWIFFLLPIHAAFGWFTVIQLWLAGIGGWFFGRTLRLRNPSAAILGLVYQGSGFMLVSAAVFPMIIAAAVWLPFMLGAIEKIVGRGKGEREEGKAEGGDTLPWVAFGAACLGLNILAGHPEITYYVLLITGMYAAWRLLCELGRPQTTDHRPQPEDSATNRRPSSVVRRLLKSSSWLLIMVFLGLLLGAIQLIPAFELAGTNFREGGATLAEVRGWAFPLRRILTLVLPNFFGNPAHHSYVDLGGLGSIPFDLNYWGNANPHGGGSSSWGIKNYVEGGIYLGILPLVLAVIGVLKRPQTTDHRPRNQSDTTNRRPSSVVRRLSSFLLHPTAFFLFLAFISLNFIFGSPLYAVLFKLPFINQLHSPFRWVFALSIAVASLAAYGMESVLEHGTQNTEHESRLPVWIAGLTALAGALVLIGSGLMLLFFGRITPSFDKLLVALAQAPDAFNTGRAFASYLQPQFLALGLVTTVGGFLLLWRARASFSIPNFQFSIFNFLLFTLIAADLFNANRGFHVANDPALLTFKPEMVSWLEAQPGHYRITAFSPKDKAFNANSGWLYNIQDIRGYDSIINRQYTNYMGAIEPQAELAFNRIQPVKELEALNSPLLDLLNVKYVITSEDIGALPKYEQVWEGEGVRIYENLGVMPRAFTLPGSAAFGVDDGLTFPIDRDPRFTVFLDNTASSIPGANGDPGDPKPANITVYTNNEVWVDVQVDDPSWLILNDSYAEGWNAFIRPFGADENAEQSLDLVRANGNFRAVEIEEPGAWTVRFRYSPRSFIIGGLTSFMGGIIILFAGVVWGWRRVYRPQGDLTSTQSIAKNSVVPMALNLFNKVIDFAFAMFYLRVLGSGDSGRYAAAISVALWFDIVANWGLDALIIRDGAQNKSAIGKYLYNTTILRLFTMLIGLIPVALFVGEAFVNGDGYPSDVLLALGLIAVGMVFSGVGKGLTGIFYVFDSAEYPATLSTITTILKVVFGVTVLLLGWSFVGLAAVSIVTNIITLTLLATMAFRKFPIHGPYTIDRPLLRNAFRVGWPLMLNHLLATVFFKIDQPLLLRLGGDNAAEQVGWYNSAYKWVDALNIIPSFLTIALFPIISRQAKENINDARRTFRMAVKLLVLIALPLAATITLLADIMIGVLGGQEFLPHGAISLRIVIWSIPIGWINSVTNYAIISLGLEKRLTFGFIVGVLFNTIGNILLIPRFGYVAAGFTTVASELILLIMFNYYLTQKMPGIGWFKLLWRPGAVVTVMVIAMYLGSLVNIWVGLLVGVVVYLIGLWLLGIIGEEERGILAQILPAGIAARLRLT